MGEVIEGGDEAAHGVAVLVHGPGDADASSRRSSCCAIPRTVGTDPETGEDVVAHNGRFGPYLKRGADTRSLASEEQLLTVTLDEAQALFAQPKQRRGRAAAAPLRELGTDPTTNLPVVVKDGRFGPYVTDGTTNASLRKGDVGRVHRHGPGLRAAGRAPRRRPVDAQEEGGQEGGAGQEEGGGQEGRGQEGARRRRPPARRRRRGQEDGGAPSGRSAAMKAAPTEPF